MSDGGGQARLLVVDDDADFARFVCEVGERYDFAVAAAGNGAIGRRRFREFRPDIVLLDLVMPHVDGIEFIDWLGTEGAHVRLIVVTGFNPNYGRLAEKLAAARGLSSVAVLTKPVRIATLLKALRGDAA
jgi:DNA-binding response OmpR family regulator